ncbi:MAG: C1 family peptidase [Litorimonas sp.]
MAIDLRAGFNAVRDQGRRPTCAAFAAAAAHAFALSDEVILSPQWVDFYAQSRFPGKGEGMSFNQLGDVIQADGQVLEADCPYQPFPPSHDWLPTNGLTGSHYASLLRHDALPEKLRSVVGLGIPIILGVAITPEFLIGGEGAPKRINHLAQPPGRSAPGHAIVLCGTASENGLPYLLVRNSWGQAWGDGGYCWISEDALTIMAVDAITLQETIL